MRRRGWIALGVIVALIAVAGLRLGTARATLSEGDVIVAYAERYVAQTGGALTDCHGEPLEAGWLTVICDGPAGRVTYDVDRSGRLMQGSAAAPSI
ncbi:MAG: hypothetical protein ACU0CI_06820 [Shimia sp.]